MKIAHVSATFPPYRGGTGNVCFHNARELAHLGHEVHVFTATPPSELSGFPPKIGGARRRHRHDFTIHRLQPLVQVGNAPVLPQLMWKLRGFDVIHLHYPFIIGAEMVRLASLMYRIPLAISFHNDLIGDGARSVLFAAYQRLSAGLTVRHASRLCAVSFDHYESSRLRHSLSEQNPMVVELPNGVDTNHFSPAGTADIGLPVNIPVDAKLLLFVAALDRAHHFKGLGTLLQAVQSMPSDTWLLVVGDGDLRSTYEQQAEALGIAERTIFVGAINHKELPPFFRRADLTVLPSSPPESFGLVLIESLGCGTAVIASNIPGVRTVVDDGRDGLLVPPNDSVALASAMKRLLADDAKRRMMGKQGRAKVEARYNWRQIGKRLARIYKTLCLEGRRSLVQETI